MTLLGIGAALVLVGLILLFIIILDPIGDEPDDRTRPGMPADRRNRPHDQGDR